MTATAPPAPAAPRGRSARVTDVFGRAHTVRAGVLDAATEHVYTHGQCAPLALALHAKTGWPLVVLLDATSEHGAITDHDRHIAADTGGTLDQGTLDRFWAHVLVERPDGLLVDIRGPQTPDTALALYTGCHDGDAPLGFGLNRLARASAEQVQALPSTATPRPGAAQLLVDAVLALPELPELPWPWTRALTAAVEAAVADYRDELATGEPSDAAQADAAQVAVEALWEDSTLYHAHRRGLLPAELRDAAGTELLAQGYPAAALR